MNSLRFNSAIRSGKDHLSGRTRGRLVLITLVLIFALPALIAKLILEQNWYQSGVTNEGILIEPRVTFSMLNMNNLMKTGNPASPLWQMGYMVPENCGELCRQQIYLLNQSYSALGKYKPRVVPVLYVTERSDSTIPDLGLTTVKVTDSFERHVSESEYLLSDPLGQLVMKYPDLKDASALMDQHKALLGQHKAMLADFRKLLKLSRVG